MIPTNDHSIIISVICYVISLIGASGTTAVDEALVRQRRQLLFPNSTLFQLNIGVGTPTPIKTINVNWALQANFQLPWNRTQIPFDILEANSGYVGYSRRRRDDAGGSDGADYENDAKLYHFYKYVEDMLDSFGHDGTSCVLQTLCRLGAEPLHSGDEEDLLHELSTFILDPLNDIKDEPSSEATPYVEAFQHGQKLLDCFKRFHCTTISLIDMFTHVHDDTSLTRLNRKL